MLTLWKGRENVANKGHIQYTPPTLSEISEKNVSTYSSVLNRRVGRNKRVGGKILRKH